MSTVGANLCSYCRSSVAKPGATVIVDGSSPLTTSPTGGEDKAFWEQPTQVLPASVIQLRCPVCGRTLQQSREADWESVCGASPQKPTEGVPPSEAPPPPPEAAVSAPVGASDFPVFAKPSDQGGGVSAPEDSPQQRPASPSSAACPGGFTPAPPVQIPGYVIEGVIGSGGMGTVYLARQLSLDRHVALKVMSSRWLYDPVFLARFTREAYAAAQLSHPNIVQIYDIGEANGVPFFSMEYVRGRSLSDLVRRQGRLDPQTAVSYILQAARGLQHAHSRGLIHRDVKPDNLLLDENGLIKVADLGLVKTPQGELVPRTPHPRQPDYAEWATTPEMTGAQIALGTPAYMSPEQCRDAASVDHRSDIYSLGCTLYVLLTGRPPFEGTSAGELMSKHAYEPPPPPEQWVPRLPRELSAILLRMMAKDPAERYQTMEEVIQALEGWLGLPPPGQFLPRPEQIDQVEAWAKQFRRSPAARRRKRIMIAAWSAWSVTELLLLFFAQPAWAVGWCSLLIHTALGYFVIHGWHTRGPLFWRVRRGVLAIAWSDWLLVVIGLLLFCVLLAVLGIFWVWWGFALIGYGVAGLIYTLLDRPVFRERRRPLEACERLLRRLRNQGIAEEQLRLFVARYAGRKWEEFFEALFGYEAKLEVRARLGAVSYSCYRERYAAWREPLIAWLDRWESQRQMRRERSWLIRWEKARLVADGENAEVATAKAQQTADALIQHAEQLRVGDRPWLSSSLSLALPTSSQSLLGSSLFLSYPSLTSSVPANAPRPSWPDRLAALLLGTGTRCLLAAFLLAAWTLWVYQNAIAYRSFSTFETSTLTRTAEALWQYLKHPKEPLGVRGIPAELTRWVDGWNIGVAAILLLVSLFYRGHVMGLFVLLGAAVTALGAHYGIRAAEPLRPEHSALILGTTLTLLGLRCARP